MLEWIYNNCKKTDKEFKIDLINTINTAITNNDIATLNWLKSHCQKTYTYFDCDIIHKIIKMGTVELMDWIENYQSKKNIFMTIDKHIISAACKRNKIDFLEWLFAYCKKTNTIFDYDNHWCKNIIKKLDIAKEWFIINKLEIDTYNKSIKN